MRRISAVAILVMTLLAVVVHAAPDEQVNEFQLFLLEARSDLELLANEALGEGVRPETWTFNTELQSETIVIDLWFDNEQLADLIFGVGSRPAGWFGATSTDPILIARNTRHDMELSADDVFGERTRPDAWNGSNPIFTCNRTLQNVVRLLDVYYGNRANTPQSAFNYCEAISLELRDELLVDVFNAADREKDLRELIWATRGDLERLADELLGVNTRPGNWTGNTDIDSGTLAADINTDLNILAEFQLGSGVRPEGWNAFASGSDALVRRSLRYNLELLADATLGLGVRPGGWELEEPLLTCPRIDQGIVEIARQQFELVVDETLVQSDSFCELVTFTANDIVENPPQTTEELEDDREDQLFTAEAEYAFAYMDSAALKYMGIIPAGTLFRAWYRNFGDSTMMFVSGEDFALYIDLRWTTMDPDIFALLPTLEGVVPLTFCDASWCNGPSPTPTPTGGGPLLAVHNDNATPIGPVDVGDVAEEADKTQVSWNHVRVTYLLDRPETGTVQVALEICATRDQIDCEPVIRVFDNALGAAKPVLSQYNGLNVYEFRYGYSSAVVIEGATRVSPDVWISEPTIR